MRTFGTAVALMLVVVACNEESGSSEPTAVPQPTAAQLAASGLGELPLAPEDKRVDLRAAPFSNPTRITNPLFPISALHAAVLNGRVEGESFHTETTLLPYTRTFEWPEGRHVETLVSQYVAFLDGRIQEVALDYYAQADDGSVWYFGEDVADYNEEGLIAFTTDTWLAGVDGPPAMIMPADPKLGDVYRVENIPGLVFEEVAVKALGRTVDGPAGPVDGAMVGRELHSDGTYDDKQFAPGYGEFFTGSGGDVEAMALAVPTDALGGPLPDDLRALSTGADQAFDAARARDWRTASTAVETVTASWDHYRASGESPPRLEPPMSAAVEALSIAVARHRAQAGTAAIDVAQATLDLELRYLPPDEINLARFELWARQLVLDAAADDPGGVSGDLATLELVRDRFADALRPAALTTIDTHLVALRETVRDEDLAASAEEAASLRKTSQAFLAANR
jgi:hypothetical protein